MSGAFAKKRKRHRLTFLEDSVKGLKAIRTRLVEQLQSSLNSKSEAEVELDATARALLHLVYPGDDHLYLLNSGESIPAMDWLCRDCHAALALSKKIEAAMEEMEKSGRKPGEVPEAARQVLADVRAQIKAEKEAVAMG